MNKICIASLIVIALSTQSGLAQIVENSPGDATCQLKFPYCKGWSSAVHTSQPDRLYSGSETNFADAASNGFSFATKAPQPYYDSKYTSIFVSVPQATAANVGTLEPFSPSEPAYYDGCTFIIPLATPTFDSTKVVFSCIKCSDGRTPVDGLLTYEIVDGHDFSSLNTLPIGSLGEVSTVSSSVSANSEDSLMNLSQRVLSLVDENRDDDCKNVESISKNIKSGSAASTNSTDSTNLSKGSNW